MPEPRYAVVTAVRSRRDRVLGANRVWERCTIRRAEGGVEQSSAWFGGIIARDGVFKFVSYANGF